MAKPFYLSYTLVRSSVAGDFNLWEMKMTTSVQMCQAAQDAIDATAAILTDEQLEAMAETNQSSPTLQRTRSGRCI